MQAFEIQNFSYSKAKLPILSISHFANRSIETNLYVALGNCSNIRARYSIYTGGRCTYMGIYFIITSCHTHELANREMSETSPTRYAYSIR